ncbi:MAG: PQQ-dependent sugar dehydrogenase [Sphingomonadales bacterium]|nr:PQQ-dependent sugar dehydrogenase [Sphingomonadales bacterium]MDE2168500.1 PQQ-dependent sugar dehydrogenase [Sphingomonadales bacterium]
MAARHFALAGVALASLAAGVHSAGRAAPAAPACDRQPGGLQLPPGFCATIFADKLGHVRHMAVAADGTIYANSAPDAQDQSRPSGLIMLRDANGDGRADVIERPVPAVTGGTGVALYRGAIYLEDKNRIIRYRLDPRSRLPVGEPATVVSGLPVGGDHRSRSLAIRHDGTMFVSIGSATNACQFANRQAGSPGISPCTEKLHRAGIWQYRADQTGQAFSPANRFASGIRNAVGLTLDSHGQLFATQHGRDQLHENWRALYTAQQGQDWPAEELLLVNKGDDFGWPQCYFDPQRQQLVLAPEYGGDGGHKIGICAKAKAPIAAFPGHWAPNGLLIYEGAQFPAAYREGAFIAFHGSWNRAPGPQQGFNIVFQPMRNGRATGHYVVFANGFGGPGQASGNALYRPTGLAMAPDGALYISDDKVGRIWRVTYRGSHSAPVQQAVGAAAAPVAATGPQAITPHNGALPAGVDLASIALGRRLWAGETGEASCSGCHGPHGEGTAVAPNLSDPEWLWGQGTPREIEALIARGVPAPKRFSAPMPADGGAVLTGQQRHALAAYVWSLSHP